MNTAETITAIVAPCTLAGAALFVVAAAREWLKPDFTLSLKFIPASKRQPRGPVQVVNVLPAADGQPADGQGKTLRSAV